MREEVIKALAVRNELSEKVVTEIITSQINTIKQAIAEGKTIKIPRFGKFVQREKILAYRMGQMPKPKRKR